MNHSKPASDLYEQLEAEFFNRGADASTAAETEWGPAAPLSSGARRAMHATFGMLGAAFVALTAFAIHSQWIMPVPEPLGASGVVLPTSLEPRPTVSASGRNEQLDRVEPKATSALRDERSNSRSAGTPDAVRRRGRNAADRSRVAPGQHDLPRPELQSQPPEATRQRAPQSTDGAATTATSLQPIAAGPNEPTAG